MRCLSCNKEHPPPLLSEWNKVLLCANCKMLAQKAEKEMILRLEHTKQQMLSWLRDHVIQGKLLNGGSGMEPE